MFNELFNEKLLGPTFCITKALIVPLNVCWSKTFPSCSTKSLFKECLKIGWDPFFIIYGGNFPTNIEGTLCWKREQVRFKNWVFANDPLENSTFFSILRPELIIMQRTNYFLDNHTSSVVKKSLIKTFLISKMVWLKNSYLNWLRWLEERWEALGNILRWWQSYSREWDLMNFYGLTLWIE